MLPNRKEEKKLKELYKAIIRKVEESKDGEKVLMTLTRCSKANGVSEAQKNIIWRLQNDDRIYLGIVKNESTTDKIVRWEMSRIDLERNYENKKGEESMKNNYKEMVKEKINKIEKTYNMSDRTLVAAMKEYGISDVSYFSVYTVRTDYKEVRFSTLKKLENGIDKLESILSECKSISEQCKLEPTEKELTNINEETIIDGEYKTIEVEIKKDIIPTLESYLKVSNLNEKEYFNQLIEKDLKDKENDLKALEGLLKKLRGDK